MMHRSVAAASFALALAGCGQGAGEEPEPKSTAEVIAEAGKLAKPQPGQYRTTVELIEFSVPGLPQSQAERLRSMMGSNLGDRSSTYCLTPAEADKGFEDMIRKMSEGQGGMACEFARFDVDGGAIDAQMTCKGAQGMQSAVTMKGTATSQGTSMRMAMTQTAEMLPGGEMKMDLQLDSRRTGDCGSAP